MQEHIIDIMIETKTDVVCFSFNGHNELIILNKNVLQDIEDITNNSAPII